MTTTVGRVGYVLKMYPRLSETFILNEILAHESAGLDLDIFSLRLPKEAGEHADLDRVRASVTYLPNDRADARAFGEALIRAHDVLDREDSELRFKRAPNPWVLYQAVRLSEMVSERGITHLHAHFATEATTVARLAARIAGVGYSFTAHAKDIFHESVEEDDLRRKVRDAAAVVTVSDYNVAFLRDLLGEDASGVRRIYNGLDINEFPYSGQERDPSKIIAVGRLVEKKGFGDLIEACALLAGNGHRFTCKIIGNGELREELVERVRAHCLEGVVEFTGSLPREEVRRQMAEAAVLAVPCVVGGDGNRDGLPTVLLEAMALGTPCVSTPVTGIPEILRHETTGLLVSEGSAGELGDAMLRLRQDRALAKTLASNARELIESEFDIHTNTGEQRGLFAAGAARAEVGAG